MTEIEKAVLKAYIESGDPGTCENAEQLSQAVTLHVRTTLGALRRLHNNALSEFAFSRKREMVLVYPEFLNEVGVKS